MERFRELLIELARHSGSYEDFVNQVKERYHSFQDEEYFSEVEDILKEAYHIMELTESKAEDFVDNKPAVRWYAFTQESGKHVKEWFHSVEMVCKGCGKIFVDPYGGTTVFCSRDCFRYNKTETTPERIIRKWLMKNNIEFEPEKRIDVGPFWTYVDFFIPPKTCIYVDGTYYHGDDFPETQKRDERNNFVLKLFGYSVIRLDGREIVCGKRPKIT